MPARRRPRVVVVTGASSGIGRALAQAFAASGDRVIACGRDRRRLERVCDLLRAAGFDCRPEVFDIRNERAIQQALHRVIRREGTIDVLINNAGVTAFKEFLETTTSEFDEIIDTGLRSLFLASKVVLPLFVKGRRGMIVNILSYAVKTTYTKSAVYSAAKSGALAMMNVLREEVRAKGVRIVNVFPGAVDTPMWPPRHRKKYRQHMMDPAVVATAVLEASLKAPGIMVEELVIRPQIGDLRV
jgi:short-subunit dehydrogenase